MNKDEGGQVPTEGDKEEWSNLYEDDFALQEPEEQNVEVYSSFYPGKLSQPRDFF